MWPANAESTQTAVLEHGPCEYGMPELIVRPWERLACPDVRPCVNPRRPTHNPMHHPQPPGVQGRGCGRPRAPDPGAGQGRGGGDDGVRRVPGVHRWVGVGGRSWAEQGTCACMYRTRMYPSLACRVGGVHHVPGAHRWVGVGSWTGGGHRAGASMGACARRPAGLAARMPAGGRTPAA